MKVPTKENNKKDRNQDAKIKYNLIGDGQQSKSLVSTHQDTKTLTLLFFGMVFIGLGNKIFQKLQTIPMWNYPNFLNLLTTFVYIPLSFAYILPMIKYGHAISSEQMRIPKKTFAIMGALDSLAGIMQVFASTYLGGSLLILLGQAAIPVSMLISKIVLHTKYTLYQYIGAVTVATGLLIVLGPSMKSSDTSGNQIMLWSLVMICSCIPMCLSSCYKEKALGETELNAIYLNGWVAIFQFCISIPLAFPAALAGNPSVEPQNLPKNLYDGMKCFFGHNTITGTSHPDDCENATIYVSIYLMFNVTYNILIILILKYGSANILWLAMTVMVPLGNVAFTFPFMPQHQPLATTDILGLVIIMSGLYIYRFLESCRKHVSCCSKGKPRNFFTKKEKTNQSILDEALLGNNEEDTVEV